MRTEVERAALFRRFPPSAAVITLDGGRFDRRFNRRHGSRSGEWGTRIVEHKCFGLTSAECDDAANGIVGRNTDRHAVAWDYLDAEAAHPAAELGQHFMPGITLNTIETSAVHRHYRSLHVDQIVFAQTSAESFQTLSGYSRPPRTVASEKALATIVPQTDPNRPAFVRLLPLDASNSRNHCHLDEGARQNSPSHARVLPSSTSDEVRDQCLPA